MRIGIIGCGRLGSALAAAVLEKGLVETLLLCSGGTDRAQALARLLNGGDRAGIGAIPVDPAEACGSADMVFLCVPDGAVAETAGNLPETDKPMVLVHTSGALGLDCLGDAARKGYTAASMHPLNTFPSPVLNGSDHREAVRRIGETWFALSADNPQALSMLQGLASGLGKGHFMVGEDSRTLYHAGAVMASNLVLALLDTAERLLGGVTPDGTPLPRECLAPLLKATVANYLAKGADKALSGPVSRGDLETVARHLQAMNAVPALGDTARLYGLLSFVCGGMALRDGRIDAERFAGLNGLLGQTNAMGSDTV